MRQGATEWPAYSAPRPIRDRTGRRIRGSSAERLSFGTGSRRHGRRDARRLLSLHFLVGGGRVMSFSGSEMMNFFQPSAHGAAKAPGCSSIRCQAAGTLGGHSGTVAKYPLSGRYYGEMHLTEPRIHFRGFLRSFSPRSVPDLQPTNRRQRRGSPMIAAARPKSGAGSHRNSRPR